MEVDIVHPQVPVGAIKSFGIIGEQYEVIKPLHQLADGDWLVEIMLIKTGETAEYCLSHIQADPAAQ